MLALDDFPFRVRFTCLNKIGAPARIQLKTVLLLSVRTFPHRNVLQGDDASRFLVRRVLEIVQTVVIEDEPPPLPALVPPTLFPQPALFVWVEEGVHEVVAVVLGNFERFCFYTIVQALKIIMEDFSWL